MSTYAPLIIGTPLTWTSSGGDKVLNAASVTTGNGRAGDKSATLVDGTKGLPALLEVYVQTQVQAAPTAGLTIDVYLAFSDSATAGTNNPGSLSGADAALSNVDVLPQLVFVGSLVLSNSLGTAAQEQRFLVAPQDQYVIPVLVNNSGQTINATGTNSKVVVTPMYQQSS